MFTINRGICLSLVTLALSILALGACQRESPPPVATSVPAPASAPAPVPAPPVATGRMLLPVDEAAKDPSLLKLRDDLLQAVDRHDAAFVIGILDPHIRNNFGGDDGIQEFKEMWHPERAASKLWNELRTVLTHGGTLRDGSFCAPYIFSSFPGDDFDPFDYAAVIEDKVVLRAKPDANASAVATLSYHLVKVDDEGAGGVPGAWMKVATTDGKSGYVPASMVRSSIDYRACFTKKSGVWRMNLFIAGD